MSTNETAPQEEQPAVGISDVATSIGLATAFRIAEAAQKHPEFAKRVLFRKDDLNTTHNMAAMKTRSQKHMDVESILFAEVYEFLYEVNRGNFMRAFDEMLDIFAVAYRAIQHMDDLEKSIVLGAEAEKK